MEREICSQKTYFSVNNDNAVAWKYIDFRSSAVRPFSNSEQLHEDAKQGSNM
jgi:hypothetical protein